ncbi:MAG: hypothetical protein KDD47_23180, partial [Acidobacteria bacterium]|nr:hypothetical protein [Acidobacteriota bacterium]
MRERTDRTATRARQRRRRLGAALGVAVFAFLASGPLVAGAVEVRLQLPVRARLDLTSRRTITIAPFLVVTQEGQEAVQRRGLDVQREFER